MMRNRSAGILLFRRHSSDPEVFLVHPGGPYHQRKDLGAWSIPKGVFDEGEEPLAAALREFREETGMEVPATDFILLQPVRLRSGKLVHAWAAEGDLDAGAVVSNTFPMEYPYKSGKWIEVPEVDRGEWFDLAVARKKLNPGQVPFLDELEAILGRS